MGIALPISYQLGSRGALFEQAPSLIPFRGGAFHPELSSSLEGSKDYPYLALMILSRITAKAQTTIPQAVRRALGVKPGDDIAYEIEGDRVVIRRAGDPFDRPFASFTEWADELDSVYDTL